MIRSWLYCPGNKPGMIKNAGIYGADGIVLDLEDSVPPAEKDEARLLVAEALRKIDFGSASVAVRINSQATDLWKDDVEILIDAGVTNIRIPKTESADQLQEISIFVGKLMSGRESPGEQVRLQVILETPRGILNAESIADSTPQLTGISFGAEDYCTSLGINRVSEFNALDFPRSMVACAASAAGIEAWDTIWADYTDIEGLREDASRARHLGFSGKSLIHPDQISIVNQAFSPSSQDIDWATEILEATDKVRDIGAFGLNGAMIDAPVIARARRILSVVDKQNA